MTVLLAQAVSLLYNTHAPLFNRISLAIMYMYRCLVSVTAEARTVAGTQDATLRAIDTGLWMKSVKNGRASFSYSCFVE